MPLRKILSNFILLSVLAGLCCNCAKPFKADNYTAYFGGEVSNPTSAYVLFCRNSEVIDSARLDANNRFFFKFDSLTPGMYSFRNDPEYQYVYFDKNDSIMVRINARDFDNSIVFCGRGDQKNNFLMELYLKNEDDRSKNFDIFDDAPKAFLRNIDSTYASRKKFYEKKKEEIKWDEGFDQYAQAAVNLHHFAKKELYPNVHHMRTGNDVVESLPKDYYDFRKDIDFNNARLSGFSPFIAYVTHMLNNMAAINYHNHFSEADLALKTNINKLNIADTLIKNSKVRNIVLNNIAFTYLLEDQNVVNNQKFLEIYNKFSTDTDKKKEILQIGAAIQRLTEGNSLPEVTLVNAEGQTVSSAQIATKKTVLFFWTENLVSHLVAAHRKILDLKAKHPEYQFVAVCLDKDQEKWTTQLSKLKSAGILELRCADFEDLRDKWAITKVHRTIVLSGDGKITNAFTNIFDVHFEDNLTDSPPPHPAHGHALAAK